MLQRVRSTNLTVPFLIAIVAILVVLAGLQYYWVDQVSAGERERRAATLHVGAQRISEDFNREIARAYLTFQMDSTTLRDQNWNRYVQRYENWFAAAPYPGMIKAIYLVEVNQIGRVQLSLYDPDTRRFGALAWPYEMRHLRRAFEQTYRRIFADSSIVGVTIDPVDSTTPALLIPVARPGLLSVQQDLGIDADLLFSDLIFPGTFDRCARCPPELFESPLLAHTIVVLDQEYLTNTMLPDLRNRYFPFDSKLEYVIGVRSRTTPDTMLYASDANLDSAAFADADARMGLFALSYDDLNRLLMTGIPRIGEDESGGERIAIGVFGSPDDREQVAPEDRGQWQLLIRHRDGSLDAAINRLQVQNLLLSFSVLFLLGISVAFLLLSTRRAQKLAEQQITFASAVSHELRTPLAVICSAGDNLADGLIHDPQQARKYGVVIANEGRRLTEMVDHVLAFAESATGRRRTYLVPVEPQILLQEALHSLHHQISAGGFQVEVDLAPDLPTIMADMQALRRALQNLLTNAMKYGGEDGWIGVSATGVYSEHGREVAISVRDHGSGIDPDDLPHLFEPFYRGRSAAEQQIHGSGLGLSLVRDTLAAHGGRISVESLPGQGSCFSLHLPAH